MSLSEYRVPEFFLKKFEKTVTKTAGAVRPLPLIFLKKEMESVYQSQMKSVFCSDRKPLQVKRYKRLLGNFKRFQCVLVHV